MKKQLLVLSLLAASLPSHAIYNLYKKDGLSLDINGEVNLYLEQDKGTSESQLANIQNELTDEKLRLFPDAGASWVDFRASQELPNEWRATGTLGLGYARGNGSAFLNSANLSFDKLNKGAITLGRQYLHTGFVARTGTYSPLDVFGEQAVRLDFYGVDNLHTSAYYLLPSSSDVRSRSNSTKTEGFGASGSYTIPFSTDHSLRVAAGYSNSKANPRDLDRYSPKSDAYAASLEYRFGKLLAAADYGRKDIKLGGNLLAKSTSDNAGVKLGFAVSPRLNLMAGYGVRKHDATYHDGVPAQAVNATIFNSIMSSGVLASTGVGFLYDNLTEKMTFVRGDYYMRDNVRVYGQVQNETIEGELTDAKKDSVEDTSYRLGVSLTF